MILALSLPPSFNWPTFTVALLAFVVSFCSMLYSRRALRLNEVKEAARRPSLLLDLNDTESLTMDESRRSIIFDVAIKNRSDDSNSVSRAELLVNCKLDNQTPLVIKVQSEANSAERGLSTPIRLDSHQTVAGKIAFYLSEEVVKNYAVRSYVLLLTDVYDNEYRVERGYVKEVPLP